MKFIHEIPLGLRKLLALKNRNRESIVILPEEPARHLHFTTTEGAIKNCRDCDCLINEERVVPTQMVTEDNTRLPFPLHLGDFS